MAAIHQLIAQVPDAALRARLQEEADVLTQGRRFGLVFERHLPEVTPIYGVRPRRGDTVTVRGGTLTDLWRVQRLHQGIASCVHLTRGAAQSWPLDQLLVVRRFGEPIFPSLVPLDKVANGPADAPWHTLIEADNYHALQLLEYLYAGQVDCIYIDPPYNTGARDWKYNNDYVDKTDSYRHSKWLAFIERRLRLAGRLLNPTTGIMIVTVDEHEVHHLRMLLEQALPQLSVQAVTVVINQKGVEQGRLSRTEEYALFCFASGASPAQHSDDLLSPQLEDPRQRMTSKPRWERLQRGGNNATPDKRPGLFYPVFIDPDRRVIVDVGKPLPRGQMPDPSELGDPKLAWPIRDDGSFATWQMGPEALLRLVSKGYVRLGAYDNSRQTWTILYVSTKLQRQIDAGTVVVTGKDVELDCVQIAYVQAQPRSVKTVWHRGYHDSGVYGSTMLKSILGVSGKFSFPKALYSTLDAIATATRDNRAALVVDFFAGSGTTLNAVNLLNAIDSGSRRCILVTNNEVAAAEADILTSQSRQPGEVDWERQGICRSVTWPRSKFTILGRRDDSTSLSSEYITGQTREAARDRRFRHIGFLDAIALDTAAKRKQMVALIDGLPQSLVADKPPFIVSEAHSVSVLFDESAAEDWLEALDGQDHITDFVIVAPRKRRFAELRAAVNDLLGPATVTEEVRRPMSEGFAANLEYFRLDFLDPEQVALKRQFREVLPLLWMRSGCLGPRPVLPTTGPLPEWLAPAGNRFAVLLEEARFGAFARSIERRRDLTHVFLVTDSEDAFQEMVAGLPAATRSVQPVQLYRDYLENFLINRGDRA